MITISKDNVILYHIKIKDVTGGIDGIRDIKLIESAISRANATFDGIDLYPSVVDKISATTYSLIRNHGFFDGNKRIGIAIMLLLLKLNTVDTKFTQKELINLGLKIAEGKHNEKDIACWINNHVIA